MAKIAFLSMSSGKLDVTLGTALVSTFDSAWKLGFPLKMPSQVTLHRALSAFWIITSPATISEDIELCQKIGVIVNNWF